MNVKQPEHLLYIDDDTKLVNFLSVDWEHDDTDNMSLNGCLLQVIIDIVR